MFPMQKAEFDCVPGKVSFQKVEYSNLLTCNCFLTNGKLILLHYVLLTIYSIL